MRYAYRGARYRDNDTFSIYRAALVSSGHFVSLGTKRVRSIRAYIVPIHVAAASNVQKNCRADFAACDLLLPRINTSVAKVTKVG